MNSSLPLAALFPGQGSQYPGMSKTLMDNFPFCGEFYEEASDALKIDLLKLCQEGPSDELQLTHNAQPALLATSFSWFKVLQKELSFKPAAAAGHSLGEYSALTSAEALLLSDAISLVRKRGELMQKAVPVGVGKMVAVIGLDDEVIKNLCKKASESEASLVVPANFNAPSQVVVAGHAAAVDRFSVLASDSTKPEQKARKLIPLNVSAPFHCPLMTPTAQDFEAFLQAAKWSDPAFPVVSNLDAQMRNTGNLIPLLRDQIDHPVLWTQCLQTLNKNHITHFIELGPSRVLTGLVKRTLENPTVFSIDSIEDFNKFELFLKELN